MHSADGVPSPVECPQSAPVLHNTADVVHCDERIGPERLIICMDDSLSDVGFVLSLCEVKAGFQAMSVNERVLIEVQNPIIGGELLGCAEPF